MVGHDLKWNDIITESLREQVQSPDISEYVCMCVSCVRVLDLMVWCVCVCVGAGCVCMSMCKRETEIKERGTEKERVGMVRACVIQRNQCLCVCVCMC